MQYKTKLIFLKGLFLVLVLVAVGFFAAGLWPVSVAFLVVAYVLDFVFRRCPHCGEHIPLRASVDHCQHCGEKM